MISVPSQIFVNPFSTNAPLLYPLRTSENRGVSDVFRRYRSGTLVENGLMTFDPILSYYGTYFGNI